jgi:CDP-diglyceride synthetase
MKDFANTLPGHGGFLDRFDCILFMNMFASRILLYVLYREPLAIDEIST